MNLRSLLDLAIGKPEAGTVNFTALHSFLQKLLGHLAVADAEVEVIEIYFPFTIDRQGDGIDVYFPINITEGSIVHLHDSI